MVAFAGTCDVAFWLTLVRMVDVIIRRLPSKMSPLLEEMPDRAEELFCFLEKVNL